MHGLTLLQDLAVVMTVAAVMTVLCHRFKIPVVLGYILAGVIVGPHTPPYPLVRDIESIKILSELGVIFLLFAIGLEFSVTKLMKVGRVAFLGATFAIVFMITIGYSLGRAFGWKAMDSLFLGAILSISSTTIIAKVLIETKKVSEKFAQVILGILVIEDLLAIVLIAMLSGLASSGEIAVDTMVLTVGRLLVFTAVSLFIGFLTVPRLLRHVDSIGHSEMIVVSVLGLCFAGSLGAVKSGFSAALGAFLMGAIIAETKQIKKVLHQMEPIRDMFTAVFFVSVGMLIRPSVIAEHWAAILVITLVMIVGQVLSCSSAAFLCGYRLETALAVGLGLAQIGEFSFIIANLGQSKGVTSAFLYPITVSVSAITTLSTPFLIRHNEQIIGFLKRVTPDRLKTFAGLYTSWARSDGGPGGETSSKVTLSSFYGAGKLHARIERLISGLTDPGTAGKAAHDNLVKFIRDEYPWEVETVDFVVPFHDCGLNRKLSDLRLRSETGATIVSINRDEQSIPNPSADTKLLPGDVVLILGNKEQVKAALDFLKKKAREPLPPDSGPAGTPKTQPFQVEPNLACVGKTIEEIRLKRRSGATVLGLQKGAEVVHNPSTGTIIEEGDVIMLFGLPEQLEAAVRQLSAKT